MLWQEPRTDWMPHDCLNAADLNRVESNTAYLASIPEVFLQPLELEAVSISRGATQFEFAPSLNRLERNIDRLRAALYAPVSWQAMRTDWASLKQAVNYQDVIRWEANLLRLHQLVQAILSEMTYCGTFACGEELVL